MADVKWIKIAVDIFDDEKILLVEQMPEGYGIITVWFKLLCLAGKQNNAGVFIINDTIPYTEEMFATIFRMPLNIVRLALTTFERFGMVEIINSTVTIPKWGKHQSLDKIEQRNEYMKKYMASYREKQVLIASGKVNSKVNSKPNVNTLELEGELEGELELEKVVSAKQPKRFIAPSPDEVRAYCSVRKNRVDADKFVDYYTANGWKVGKNAMKDWKAAVRTWEKNDLVGKGGKKVNFQDYDQGEPVEYKGIDLLAEAREA